MNHLREQASINEAALPPALAVDDEADFVAWAESRQTFAVNCGPARLESVLTEGHFTTFLAELKDALSKQEFEKRLEADEWLYRRWTFEQYAAGIEGAGSLFYSALNLGDAGLLKFGVYCLILGTATTAESVAIGGDSLRDYWAPEDRAPNRVQIELDVLPAVQACRVLLRELGRRGMTIAHDPEVCHAKHWYIEVISFSPPNSDSISKARLSGELFNSRRRAAMQTFSSHVERAIFAQDLRMRELILERQIELEMV